MSEQQPEPIFYAPVSHLTEAKNKYDSQLAFIHSALRDELDKVPAYPSRISRYAEQYNFCFRISAKLSEWLMREAQEGKHGPEVEITGNEAEYFKSVVMLDVFNEVAASYEDNISIMKH